MTFLTVDRILQEKGCVFNDENIPNLSTTIMEIDNQTNTNISTTLGKFGYGNKRTVQ